MSQNKNENKTTTKTTQNNVLRASEFKKELSKLMSSKTLGKPSNTTCQTFEIFLQCLTV